jgi:hypothetical protein
MESFKAVLLRHGGIVTIYLFPCDSRIEAIKTDLL